MIHQKVGPKEKIKRGQIKLTKTPQSLKRVSPRFNAEIVAGSLSPAGAVLNLIARPRTRLNTYPTRFYGSLLFSRCFAVCFDRIVLPSLSDRHAFNGLAMLINYSYIPLRRGERVAGNS